MKYSQVIAESFGRMDDDELLDQYRRGGFTREAQLVIESELRSRGLDSSPSPAEERVATPQPRTGRSYLRSLWWQGRYLEVLEGLLF